MNVNNPNKLWEITKSIIQSGVKEDKERLESLLSEGWEPFAVTGLGYDYVYHFRRLVI